MVVNDMTVIQEKINTFEKNLKQRTDKNRDVLSRLERAERLLPYASQVSSSQYYDYQICPHQWQLRNKDKNFVPNDNYDIMFGNILHEFIQEYVRVRYNESKEAAQNIDFDKLLKNKIIEEKKRVEHLWEINQDRLQDKELPFTKEDLKDFYRKAKPIVEEFKKFKDELFIDRFELFPKGIEFSIDVPVTDYVNFFGRMDIILYDKEKERLLIIDIKASTFGWEILKERKSTITNQILSYKHYLKKYFDENITPIEYDDISVMFLIVNQQGTGKGSRYDYIELYKPNDSYENLEMAKNSVENFIDTIFDENGLYKDKEYVKVPDEFHCKRCPYNSQWETGNGLCDQDGVRFE